MAKTNDLTGSLRRLKEVGALPQGSPPVFSSKPIKADERPFALDTFGLLGWTFIVGFYLCQLLIIFWLLRT